MSNSNVAPHGEPRERRYRGRWFALMLFLRKGKREAKDRSEAIRLLRH